MTAGIYGLCLALMLVMRFAAQSPLGRWLNFNLVEAPLARAARLERHHLIFIAIVLAMAMVAGETIAVYGSFEWAMISAFDMSVYIDAIAATMALAAMVRLRAAMQVVRARLSGRSKPRTASRRRRARRVRPATPAQNDDDHPAIAQAA